MRPVSRLAAGLLAVSLMSSHAVADEPAPAYGVDRLADGVWLLRPAHASAERTNSLVVERDDGLLVVESQPSPQAALELLGVIATISEKPVRYLVLSHAHAESTGGASAFPAETLVIGSVATHEALSDPDSDLGAEVRARSGADWTPPPRRLPTLVVSSSTTLADSRNAAELLPIAQSHAPGVVSVHLEAHGLEYYGPVVFPDRNPYAADADVTAWIGVLNGIARRSPQRIVPLRGEPIDANALRRLRDSLAWALGQVENAFIEQVPSEEISAFAMDSPALTRYFDVAAEPSFVRTVFDQLTAEIVTARRRRGIQ